MGCARGASQSLDVAHVPRVETRIPSCVLKPYAQGPAISDKHGRTELRMALCAQKITLTTHPGPSRACHRGHSVRGQITQKEPPGCPPRCLQGPQLGRALSLVLRHDALERVGVARRGALGGLRLTHRRVAVVFHRTCAGRPGELAGGRGGGELLLRREGDRLLGGLYRADAIEAGEFIGGEELGKANAGGLERRVAEHLAARHLSGKVDGRQALLGGEEEPDASRQVVAVNVHIAEEHAEQHKGRLQKVGRARLKHPIVHLALDAIDLGDAHVRQRSDVQRRLRDEVIARRQAEQAAEGHVDAEDEEVE
eukprot:3045012-Prymnesium_polylepis.1